MSNIVLPKGRVKKYHKRSLWACDECKLRKKKCDGNQPCRTCNLYEKECTYESRTRPSQPPTQRIRELEENIRSVRELLGRIKSDLSGNSLSEVERMIGTLKPAAEVSPRMSTSPIAEGAGAPALLRSMLVGRGRLLHSGDRTLFHGPYSGPAVICSVLEFFERTNSEAVHKHVIELFDQIGVEPGMGATRLPEKSEAIALFNIVLAQTHPFFQFIDQATLGALLEKVYDAPMPPYADHHGDNLVLCHILLALGCILDVSKHGSVGCESAMLQANDHFLASRRMLDLTAVDCLTRLKTVLCTVVFFICKSWLSSAYTYISIASTSAIKQGLHITAGTSTPSGMSQRSPHDQLITTLVSIDLYVSSVLGLPPIVNIDTPGTTLAATRDSHNVQPRSQGYFGDHSRRHNLQATPGDLVSKYCDIVSLTAGVLWDFSSASTDQHRAAAVSDVDTMILKSAEEDLSKWTKGIGIALSPSAPDSDDVPIKVSIARHELELSFYWSQLLLYLPFLHYLRPLADGQQVPESLSRPALTCLKIAVNTIVRCEALLDGLSDSDSYQYFVHPSNWACVYTVCLAVIALIFLISIHDGTSKPSEAWRKAETGIKILAALRCHEGGAGPCLSIIKDLVRQLNYTVDFDIEEIERTTARVCQRKVDQGSGPIVHHGTFAYERESSANPVFQSQDVSMGDEQPIDPAAFEGLGSLSSADAMLAKAQSMLTTNDLAVEDT